MHDILHKIIEKLPIHSDEKADLHHAVELDKSEENPPAPKGEDNGNG